MDGSTVKSGSVYPGSGRHSDADGFESMFLEGMTDRQVGQFHYQIFKILQAGRFLPTVQQGLDLAAAVRAGEFDDEVREEAPPVKAAPRAQAPQEFVVYFVRFADRVKIGTTGRLQNRLSALPHDEVLATIPGSYDLEKRLHARFRRQRIHGEWFTYDGPLKDYIQTLL